MQIGRGPGGAPANRRRFAAFALVACCLLAGCGSFRLHSEVRQKQGEDASKAWEQVELATFFDAERENLAKLLAEEVESSRRLAAANRESEIRELARRKISELPDYFNKALGKLIVLPAGVPFDDGQVERLFNVANTAGENLAEERRQRAEVERSMSFLQSLGTPLFTCAQLRATPPGDVDAWKMANPVLAKGANQRLMDAKKPCDAIETQRTAFSRNVQALAGSGSILAGYVKDWDRAALSMAARQQETRDAQAAFAEAAKQFEAEAAKAVPGTPPSAKVKELAVKLADLLNQAESVQEVFGKEWASEERIRRIDALLASLQAGTTLDSDTASKGEVVASMLPAIADDARRVADAKKGAHLVSMLIQRDVEQGKLKTAKVLAAIQKKDLAIREAIVRASLNQVFTFLKARRQIGWVVACAPENEVGPIASCKAGNAGLAVHAAWDTYPPKTRKILLEATTLYLDAFSRQDVNVKAMTTEYLALSRERTVALSEVSAGMWVGLIDASVGQAADFASLGLKVEDIEKVLNLLAIFYIGHGVNK